MINDYDDESDDAPENVGMHHDGNDLAGDEEEEEDDEDD